MAKKMAVRILFPNLTHAGTIYKEGDIVENPTSHFIECAKERTTQYHRDNKENMRICEFVPSGTKRDDSTKISYDDILGMAEIEIVKKMIKYGFSRNKIKDMSREKMEDIILRLQE